MNALPIIDIAPLITGNRNTALQVVNQLGQAARETGFFYVVNHSVPLQDIEAAYQMAKTFFSQPDAYKQTYYIGRSVNHRGYVPFSEKGSYADEVCRHYEAFDLALELPSDDPDYLAGNLLLGPNVWPDLAGFQTQIYRYYQAIAGLGRILMKAFELHLGLALGTFTNQMSKPISQLRLIHYVRPNETKQNNTVNMGAHTDYECLTLLHQCHEGLQAMTLDNIWIDIPVRPEAFLVNTGDMLETWTNGIFRSTPHRVKNVHPERYSMPYFVATNYDTVIKPLDRFVTVRTPAMYQPFKAGLHLERMLRRDFPYLRTRKSKAFEISPKTPMNNPFENRITFQD